jgi:hypothetical protein
MKVMKKPVVLRWERAIAGTVIETKEGPVAAGGDCVLLTGTKGEQWPMPRSRFEETYNFSPAGSCFKKPLVVEAVCMSEPFTVLTNWSPDPLTGKPGDWHLTYGPDDFGIVDADIFLETYDVVE